MKRYSLSEGKMLSDDEGQYVAYKEVQQCIEELQIAIEGVLFTYCSTMAPAAIENLKCVLNMQQEEQKIH